MSDSPTHAAVPTGRIGAMFDALAADYDQSGVPFFEPIATGLVRCLAPRPGERALDIGCGRGAASLPLAEAVLPTGSLTAVDLSGEMVTHTRSLLSCRGHAAVVVQQDAARLDLPRGAYDIVASSLVLFFVDRPREAVRAWVELLAPGGRIGLSTFGPAETAFGELTGLLSAWAPPGLRDPKVAPADNPFASDGAMEAMLEEAGAADARTVTVDLPVTFHGVQDWRRWSMGTGQRAMWDAVPDDERPGVLATAEEILAARAGPDGATILTQGVRYTLGHR